MSLKSELKKLRQKRRAELARLGTTYIATKREVKRVASPDRFMRKHIGLMLATAAAAGLILAPRPTPDVAPEAPRPAGGRIAEFFHDALKPLVSTDGAKPKESRPQGMLGMLMMQLFRHIEINKVVAMVVRLFDATRKPKDDPSMQDDTADVNQNDATSPSESP